MNNQVDIIFYKSGALSCFLKSFIKCESPLSSLVLRGAGQFTNRLPSVTTEYSFA